MQLDPEYEKFVESYIPDYETAIGFIKKLLTEEIEQEQLSDEIMNAFIKSVNDKRRKEINNET